MDEKGTMGTGRKANGHVRHGSMERFTSTMTQSMKADYCCIAAAAIVTSSTNREDTVLSNGFASKPDKLLSNGLMHKHEAILTNILAPSGDASFAAVKLREDREVREERRISGESDSAKDGAADDEEFEDCALYVDIITIIGYIYLHM